jgi:hypothetical protein
MILTLLSIFITISASADSSKISQGCFVLQSKGCSEGLLSCTAQESPSGLFAQIFTQLEEPLDLCKPELSRHICRQNGTYRDHVLWEVTPVEQGCYTIKNRSVNDGLGKII